MERPIRVPEIPEHLEAILKVVPDFQMTPERWRERDGTVFVEASNRATVGATPAQWRSVYCVDLEGDRVIRGRRYYDRRALFALLNPALPALPSSATESCEVALPLRDPKAGDPEARDPEARDPEALARDQAARWAGGRPKEIPEQHRGLAAALRGLRLELVDWAGDAELVFLEWQATAEVGGAELGFGLADRIDLAGGQADARPYFDTLTLATALAPPGAA